MKNKRKQADRGMQPRNSSRRPDIERLENRQMLAGDSGRQVLHVPDAVAPAISEVFVSSPVFGSKFKDHLVSSGVGMQGGFLRVPLNSSSTIPWSINRIRLKFTEDVDLVMSDITVRGVNSSVIQPTAFYWDPIVFELTLDIPVVVNDKLEVTLGNAVQSKRTGLFVDGISDDTDPSSPFVFRLNVLTGDVNRNGRVTSVDVNSIRDSLFSVIGSPNYNIYNDTNGDGRITSVDANTVRDNLFGSLPSGAPLSTVGQLKPGISRIENRSINEDSGLQTILFAANTSAGPIIGQTDLQFSITSSNPQLVDGAAASVIRVGKHYALQFRPIADQFGTTQLTIGVMDAAGTTSTNFDLQVLPINDPPFVRNQPGTIELTWQTPEKTIDLDTIFIDPEGSALSYRLTGFDPSLVAASINGSQLTLRGLENKTGHSSVVIEARDSEGAFNFVSINTHVNRPQLEPLTTFQYAVASDQVIEFQGQNTFVIQTNFDDSRRITVSSSNEGIIHHSHIEVSPLGSGKHRINIRHQTSEYGFAILKVLVQDIVISEFFVLVLPSEHATYPVLTEPVFSQTFITSASGEFKVDKTFNEKFLAMQVRDGILSAGQVFQVVRPLDASDALAANAAYGAVSKAERVDGLRLRMSFSTNVQEPLNSRRSIRFSNVVFEDGDFHAIDSRPLNIAKPDSPFVTFATTPLKTNFTDTLIVEPPPAELSNEEKARHTQLALMRAQGSLIKGNFAQEKEDLKKQIEEASGETAVEKVRELLEEVIENYLGKRASQIFGIVGFIFDNPAPIVSQANEMAYIERWNHVHNSYFTALDELALQQSVITDQFVELSVSARILDGRFLGSVSSVDIVNKAKEINSAFDAYISSAKQEVDERIIQGPSRIAIDPARIPEAPAQDISNIERSGENGQEAAEIDSALDAASGKKFDLGKTLKSVMKIYDIVKKSQKIIETVGKIFGSSSDKQGGYQDHDGKTYNMYEAQRGVDARHGTSDRDIINTGIMGDEVYGYEGDDRISTLEGDDFIDGGAGRNTYFAGPGNDKVRDRSGGSYISTGDGADTIWPGSGNDVIESGTGDDTVIFEGTDLGNNVLVDPSRLGTIQFTSLSIEQLVLRKDKNDLEIIAPSLDNRVSNSIKFVSFFESDAAGWKIIDRLGNTYSLYELTGRITSNEALEIAFKPRVENSRPAYPADIVHLSTITDSSGRFKVHVAEDRRSLGGGSPLASPGLLLTFDGDRSLNNWLSRNEFASLGIANEVISGLLSTFEFAHRQSVTIVGIGEGGLIAQWFAAVAATRGPSFVNVQLVNTPDISGLISQIVRSDVAQTVGETRTILATARPEYVNGFRVLSTNYLVNPKDWISKIGIWSGGDKVYANWKAFDFFYDPLADSTKADRLSELEAAHAPGGPELNFSRLQLVQMDDTEIQGIVSFRSVEDMGDAFANLSVDVAGETFDSTTNARILLIDHGISSRGPDPIEGTIAIRAAFLNRLLRDATAADPDSPFHLQFDFQARSQNGEHLEEFHQPVTEATTYNEHITGLPKYGWDSISGLQPGQDRGKASRLERDSVKVANATFIVDLKQPNAGPGTYNISITVGDREEVQESLQISINGYVVDQVSTMPGDFLTRIYQVNTLESELRISFLDIGGRGRAFAVNGVSIEKVNYQSEVFVSETLDDDMSIVILTQSYELPETTAGIEIYKAALKAAAVAAVGAAGGAVLAASGPLGVKAAVGLGGGFKAGAIGTKSAIALAAKQGAALGFKNAAIAGFKAAVGPAIKTSVLGSLKKSIPKYLIKDPNAKELYDQALTLFDQAKGTKNVDIVAEIKKKQDLLDQIKSGLTTISDGLEEAEKLMKSLKDSSKEDKTAPWIYETVNALAKMTQQFRLGKLDTAFVPVDLEAVERAIAAGKTPKQLLKLWQGSRDFLVLDWVPTSDSLVKIDADDHRGYVNRSAKALKALLEAYTEFTQESAVDVDLDLLLISHGAGYDINRELVNRLNTSDSADRFDYVKLVTLDPISASQDDYIWPHPEMNSLVDRIDNLFQTEKIEKSWWGNVQPIITFGAGDETSLFQGGAVIGPLDGREGGSSAGFYNRQARIFDLTTTDEILRFRHWDTNAVKLSTAELTDIEFSPDGKLVAASGADGMVTVRYVDDFTDPVTGKVSAAGKVKFIVWGQEAKVRSVAFMQMEVDGVWKDYLLTISAANNPANTDIDKNKVLLTDVDTGLPVWQGKDVAGTQVEASPSGNVIVSTDSRGNAKIWRRVLGTVTFADPNSSVTVYDGPNSDYVADVLVINDNYFVTAGLNGRMKLFRITDSGATLVQTEAFDNPTEGAVRNLDYDPYNGILAVAAGEELSLWRFDQKWGILSPFAPTELQSPPKFTIHDHVAEIQGVAFSKPKFLLDKNGNYYGDRTVKKADGTVLAIPRTKSGDIDLNSLPTFLSTNGFSTSYAGLKLLTGGEDKTLFLYSLDALNVGSIIEENVLSGSMLPIREVTLSPDGRRVAVVGEDNIDGNDGGPVKDIDVTAALDDRLGWAFSELFLSGRREHNAVPQQYIYDVIEEKGESYFWLKNSDNANRPGDLDKAKNLALPPNKRNNVEGVDIAEMDMYLRPGQTIEILPLQWLLEVDRQDYQVDQATLVLGDVKDSGGVTVGTIKLKRSDSGQVRPNIFVFEAAENLDYTAANKTEFVGVFNFDIVGPNDLEGKPRRIEDAEITFRIINHKPTTHRDVVNLHPNRQIIDLRPRLNDYDFDNDDFSIIPVPVAWQTLRYRVGENTYEVARYRRNPDDSRGVDIDVTVSEEQLEQIIANQNSGTSSSRNFIPVEFEYQVKEDKYKAVSKGIVEIRLQLPAGPENVRYNELGADQVLIQWDPVTWGGTNNSIRYVIERYEDASGWVKHSPNSDIEGRSSDSLRIKIQPNTNYWFRVVARNINSGRERASYEGTDKSLMLYVPATDYVGPGSVKMESLGPEQIEVRWEKVFWDVDQYRIDLHQITLDANGQPLKDNNGNYVYNPSNSRDGVVQKGKGLSFTFKRLDSGTPYLAVVTAKNTGNISKSTSAEFPIFTSERQIPAGIDFVRVGPEKVMVSWGTVDYASMYRAVAINPVTLVRTTSNNVEAVNSRNTNDVVINRLASEATYVVFVEAKSRKTGEWVTLIDDEPQTPVLPHRDILPGDISPGLGAGVTSTYLIPHSFANTIALPSLQGLFAGTEFTLVNFSVHPVVLHATDGEISLAGTSSTTQTLKPAYGNSSSGNGSVVYGFVASTVPGQPGQLRWEVRIGDETSEARVVTTPPFLAAEPFNTGEVLKKSLESLPKQLKIDWITPFWEVSRHRIEIFNYDPVTGATSRVPGVPAGDRIIANLTGKDRSHTFEWLKPDTNYLVKLTTIGDGKTLVYEVPFKTDPQRSPSGVYATDHTLTSFTANWTSEKWNVQRYRVSFAKLGPDGNPIESTRDYRIISDVKKTSQVVNDLESGVTYSFTVEAESKDDGWLPNTAENTKKVTILLPSDLRISGLKLDAARAKQIDLSWDKLTFVPESLFFEIADAGTNDWIRRNGDGVAINRTAKTLEDLKINHSYDVRLVAKVKDSAGAEHRIESAAVPAKTQWAILGLDEVTETKARVEFPRFASATKYDIRIYEKANGALYDSLTLDQNDNNPRRPTVEGLLPGTWFDIEVVARNGQTVLATTPRESIQTRPLVAAQGLTVSLRKTFSIGLTWTKPAWEPDVERILIKRSNSSDWSAIAPVVLKAPERQDAKITINGLDDGVSYDFRHQVVVNTIKGDRTLESDIVTASTKPAQGPTEVKIVASETGRRRFVVEWNHPEKNDVTGFTVQAFDGTQWRPVARKDADGNFVNGTNLANSRTQFEVTYIRDAQNNWKLLKAGTIYRVRVLAIYLNDVQVPNADDPAVQVETKPIVAATNITVSDVTTSQIRLNWDHIDPVGGINFFRILMKGEGDADWVIVKDDLAENVRRSLITDLVAGRKYEFQIKAVYVQKADDRDFESADALTGPHSTIPAPPVSGLGTSDLKATSVVVNWDRLSGVGVTHYEVRVYKDGALVRTLRSDQNINQRQSKEVVNLEAGTTYEVIVVAFDGSYSISQSVLHDFSTLIDGLTVDEETPFSARANWTQFAGSGATDYRVRALLPGTNTVVSQKTVTIGSGLRRTTLDGLSPGTNYEMIVEVLRNQTVLTKTDRVAFKTKEAELTGVTTTDVRRFLIDVAWNSVAEWATWTKVQWRKVGASTWRGSGELSGSRLAYTITGDGALDEATTYEIKVSANGNGIYREVTITRTTADFVKPSMPTFTSVGTREITVNWTHEDPAGAPEGFAIFRNGEKIDEVGAGARAFRDTGLHPNTIYTYFIRAKYSQGIADSLTDKSRTLPVDYVAASITSITNVRSGKVNVNWTFGGDINEVENFTIHRNNAEKTQLGFLNPANFPGQTSFTREISRDPNAKWWIFVRVRYKDGTIKDSAIVQLP